MIVLTKSSTNLLWMGRKFSVLLTFQNQHSDDSHIEKRDFRKWVQTDSFLILKKWNYSLVHTKYATYITEAITTKQFWWEWDECERKLCSLQEMVLTVSQLTRQPKLMSSKLVCFNYMPIKIKYFLTKSFIFCLNFWDEKLSLFTLYWTKRWTIVQI